MSLFCSKPSNGSPLVQNNTRSLYYYALQDPNWSLTGIPTSQPLDLLECSSLNNKVHSLTSFRFLLQPHLLRQDFPDFSTKILSPNPFPALLGAGGFFPFILSHVPQTQKNIWQKVGTQYLLNEWIKESTIFFSLKHCKYLSSDYPDYVLSRWVVSSFFRPHGLQPTRPLCPWGFFRQEYWSGLSCPSLGDLPNSGIELRSPTLQVDSLPSEPPGKPMNTGVGSLSLVQGIFLTQEWNQGLLHCRWILYHMSYLLQFRHILFALSKQYIEVMRKSVKLKSQDWFLVICVCLGKGVR